MVVFAVFQVGKGQGLREKTCQEIRNGFDNNLLFFSIIELGVLVAIL